MANLQHSNLQSLDSLRPYLGNILRTATHAFSCTFVVWMTIVVADKAIIVDYLFYIKKNLKW